MGISGDLPVHAFQYGGKQETDGVTGDQVLRSPRAYPIRCRRPHGEREMLPTVRFLLRLVLGHNILTLGPSASNRLKSFMDNGLRSIRPSLSTAWNTDL
jgi:hypothetical protein